MELFDLSGRTAVVTGGNRGIGLGMARGLAKAGASVAIWSRDEEQNARAVAELEALGAASVGLPVDVGEREAVEAALTETEQALGEVTILFANAGTTANVDYVEMDDDEWSRLMAINVDGVHHCTQVVISRLVASERPGSIVITASLAAHLGMPWAPHYAASKGAVLQLARSLAVRYGRRGIRVNVVSPGWVETDMTEQVKADDRANTFFMTRTPVRRWGQPEDFESIAVFLASDGASFVTGAEFLIDGGFSAS